jgi:hypothetical protein
MLTTFDRFLFTQIGLDSASLTMLGTVVHGFREAGEYRGTVRVSDRPEATFYVSVDKSCAVAQANIDLAKLTAGNAADAGCCDERAGPRFVVHPKGYAVFHVGSGPGGYSVNVRRADEDPKLKAYDSRELQPGDIYSAVLFGAQASLSVVSPWLDALVPGDDAELLSDEACGIWVGAAFGAGGSARLKVYANAKWGSAGSRWARLDAYAARFGVATDWRCARAQLSELQPLGASLVIGARAAPAGRIYLSGYGKPWHDYEALGSQFGGPAFGRHLRQYGQTLLGDDCAYPTRSAVVSFGLQHGAIADVKVELCAHCAFDSDVQARSRCVQWLQQTGVDPALYLQMVDRMSADPLCATETRLHAYLGIGSGRGRLDSTFYFNPAAARS